MGPYVDTKVMQESVLPTARQMQGFKGVLTLGDQSTGKSVTLTFWENEEALKATERAADELRRSAAEQMDEEIAAVERFEVYLSEWPTD
ncbi:MAG: hypothetical protein ACLGIB_09950 [Actinomycetota bacterium]